MLLWVLIDTHSQHSRASKGWLCTPWPLQPLSQCPLSCSPHSRILFRFPCPRRQVLSRKFESWYLPLHSHSPQETLTWGCYTATAPPPTSMGPSSQPSSPWGKGSSLHVQNHPPTPGDVCHNQSHCLPFVSWSKIAYGFLKLGKYFARDWCWTFPLTAHS